MPPTGAIVFFIKLSVFLVPELEEMVTFIEHFLGVWETRNI